MSLAKIAALKQNLDRAVGRLPRIASCPPSRFAVTGLIIREKEERLHTMNQLFNLKTSTLAARNLISPAAAGCEFPVILIAFTLALFALPQAAQAGPDDEYPYENTAEGNGALYQITTNGATGVANTAIGFASLYFDTGGSNNTASGFYALRANTTGIDNTASGSYALTSNQTGSYNTANGVFALETNSGNYNTAIGAYTLLSNGGDNNTAIGAAALGANSTGTDNTASGYQALVSNTTGSDNTANGFAALFKNTTGGTNTATGINALQSNTTASDNTATGADALENNTTGNFNTANGDSALLSNTTASYNTATGISALFFNTTGMQNTATGALALSRNTTGGNNIALGYLAGQNLTTGSNNIDIGNGGVAGEAAKIRIGKQGMQNGTFIAGIYNVAVTGSPVVVNSNGKLGIGGTSSIRFKETVKPIDKASEAILALKPVTFRYKQEIDPDGIPQFGLIAEEVEKVNPDLVIRDDEGKVMSVRYDAVNAMLLNEFLKEHKAFAEQQQKVERQDRKIQEQEATIAQLKSGMEVLTATVKEQASQIQKVSDQLEVSRRAPQMVANNQ
jgi:trimeric autotransporter adhesin